MSESSSPAIKTAQHEILPVQVTRRSLLKTIVGGLGACGLAAVFYGTYRYLSPDAEGRNPVEISLADIPSSGVSYFQYGGSPGVLLQGEGESFKAFSLVCTHLACTVTWRQDKNDFYCPCHDGFFDSEGRVVSGPPPGPLERWKVEVKGDKVVISA